MVSAIEVRQKDLPTIIPNEWKPTLAEMLSQPIHIPIAQPAACVQQKMELQVITMQVALHWMIRHKWSSKYKIPATRKLIQATEKTGNWLKCIRELCDGCHEFGSLGGLNDYETPHEWFRKIMFEFFVYGQQVVLYSLYPVGEFEQVAKEQKGTKRYEIRILNQICSQIRGYEEPLRPRFALGQLICMSMKLAEPRIAYDLDTFRKQKYTPFVKAFREMISEMEEHWVTHTYGNNGSFYRQIGRGRGKVNLTQSQNTELRSRKTLQKGGFKT